MSYFFIALTCFAWFIGVKVQEKTKFMLCNPLLVAVVLIVTVLSVLGIQYEEYQEGTGAISLMLGPVTTVLGLHIYQQRTVLKRYFLPILLGCTISSVSSIAITLGLAWVFGLDEILCHSLLPKNITNAIAMPLAESKGGHASLAAAAVMVSGVTGAIGVPVFAKIFHITNPIAEGIAVGSCSHALGTNEALKRGEVQGATSSIAICICGIITSALFLFL